MGASVCLGAESIGVFGGVGYCASKCGRATCLSIIIFKSLFHCPFYVYNC
jgi:hypothetical protein